MNTSLPIATLGDVMSPVERLEAPMARQIYRQLGVKLWGAGAYEREPLDGSQTKYKTLSRVETDDIVVNKIWARNGSVAVVPTNLAGCFVSGEFPTFFPNRKVLHPRWFHWFTKVRSFWNQCDEKSRGTSGQNRIRPERFLQVEIPLPSLSEQQRVVARIEQLAAKIEEARELRRKACDETGVLINSFLRQFYNPAKKYPTIALEEACLAIIDNLHSNPVYADEGIPCIRSSDVGWGKVNLDTARKTTEEEYVRRTIRGEPSVDDIVLVREGGGTGKAAIVEEGQRFSLGQRVMMLRPNKSLVLPRFFLYQLLSPAIYNDQVLQLSKGSASPHLNISALRKFTFLLPPLHEQHRIVAYLDDILAKVDGMKHLQAKTATELEALLPSVLDQAFKGDL